MPRKRSRNQVYLHVKQEETFDDEEYGIQPGASSSSATAQPYKRRENELNQLMDSLSGYYTPVTGRRSSKPIIKLDGGTIGSSDEDDKTQVRKKVEEMKKKAQQPLSVDVNLTTMDASSEAESSSKIQKNLTDSLSPYFSASKEKRRTVKRGEFLSLSGVRQKAVVAGDQSEGGATTDSTVSPIVVMPERRKNAAGIGQVVGRRRTQNSASAALFGSPEKEVNEEEMESSSRIQRPRTPKHVFSPKGERKLSQPSTSRVEMSPLSSDGEYYQKMKEKKKTKKKKSEKLGNRKDGSMISGGIDDKENIVDDGSITINTQQRDMFETIRQKVSDAIALGESTSSQYQDRVDKEPRLPRAIRIGRYQVETWYSSPFPMEYIHVPILYMCDFCLKYVKTENMMINHLKKCKLYHPPGAEIYRKDGVSVFEVDGNLAKTYCQNLCLLSKSFLDHKTLFYDVEPFLFYVVTKNDSDGCHFVGYFSKEKYSQQKFNLSCIVTLPCYQKQGFGRFLIDFSFLLSRSEKMPGTPEKPLSDLGRISYASYWRTALFEWIHQMNLAKEKNCEFSIDEISLATGISKYDIAEVFDTLGWFKMDDNGDLGLYIDYDLINSHWEKAKKDKQRIWLDEKNLKWNARFFSPSKDNFRSPLRTPVTPKKTPTSATAGTKTSTPSGVSLAAVGSTIKSGVSTRRRAPVGRNLKQKIYEEEKVREILDDSTNSESESSDETEVKKVRRRKTWGCKESTSRKTRRREDTPDDDTPKRGRREAAASSKKANTSERRNTMPSGSSNSHGGNGSRRTNVRRGKMIFEDSSDACSSSSPVRSDSSDDDASSSVTGKPQKGKAIRPAPPKNSRKKPPQKGNKNPPGELSHLPPKKSREASHSKRDPIIESASEVGAEKEKEPEEEKVEVASMAVEVNDTGPPKEEEEVDKDETMVASRVGPSTTTTTSDESDSSAESDDEKKMDVPIDTRYERMTPLSTTTDNSAISSRAVTPRPRGDQPVGDDMINMGFVPDYDDQMSRFGAQSEENDGPPPLDIERMCHAPTLEDDAPPVLMSTANTEPQGMMTLDVPHEPDGYSTGEDDAPPQLSPNFGKTEQDELSEKEKILEAMDRPPMAPVAAGMEIDEEEKLYHQQLSANAQVGIGSVGAPGSNQMMMQQQQMPNSSCQNMMTSTPQHPYSQGPGSMQQATPGSGGVPSCSQMYNHSTPEQQQQQQHSQQNPQAFMSPSMGMPSSVSSVHSAHNNSMEMVPGPSQPPPQPPQQQQQQQPQNQYAPLPEMMQNMPSTSTAQQEAMHMQARMQQFGSPPASQQQVVVPQQQVQAQPVQQRSNGRSTESGSSRKHRQQQQQQQQQQLQHQQQLQQQQQQHIQQMQQMNQMQFHGYPPGYPPGYPYAQFDAFNYQYWQGGMFPQYYAPARMPAAAANQPWPGYPNGAAAQGGAAANMQPNQFPQNPAAPFGPFPQDIYQNFYMKNG